MPGESVTVQRSTPGTDPYGNTVPDWTDPEETEYEAVFEPSLKRGAEHKEYGSGRTTVIDNPIVYLPAGADVLASDRIVARDETYEINGGIVAWNHPVLGPVGIVVELRRVSG